MAKYRAFYFDPATGKATEVPDQMFAVTARVPDAHTPIRSFLHYLEETFRPVEEEFLSSHRYIICCDFDGVLHSYISGWKGAAEIPDPPVKGAMAWLDTMTSGENKTKFWVNVYSSRSKTTAGVDAMKSWLRIHLYDHYATSIKGLGDAEIRQAVETVMEALAFPTQKPAASMTIDDRAFCFQGTFPTTRWLMEFRPWNR